MTEEEDIPNDVEKELGFENCTIKKVAAKSLGIFQDKEIDNFELECENTYKDQYNCKGEYNKKTRSLKTIDCEKI
ncbi:MAG: hypothetical protein ACFE9T_03160 [Promethearchaeota archaeon]